MYDWNLNDRLTSARLDTVRQALEGDIADTFDPDGNFKHGFDDLQIENPTDTFAYTIVGRAIEANRNLDLPLLTGNDVVVTEAHTQTLTNKTITAPNISDFTNMAHDHGDADDGGAIVPAAIPANAIDAITEIAAALKSGSDGTLITGTAGTASDLAIWNGDGDLVDGPTPPSGDIVGTSDSQTLSAKTLTTPTIGSFANAAHDHEDAAGGAQLDTGALATDAVTEKAVATGSSSDPTTTSGTAAELTDMTITHTVITNEDVLLTFTGTFESTGLGDEIGFQFDRDGTKLGAEIIIHAAVATYQIPVSLSWIDVGPGTGSKVYAVHWRRVGGSGTAKSRGTRRYMTLTGYLK